MTPAELEAVAARALATGCDRVTLTVPADWRAPRGFPRQELLSVNGYGWRNISVSARRLAAWCKAGRLL